MPVAWPGEPHPEKEAFFEAIGDVAGGGARLPVWRVSGRSFPETAAKADEALSRAKKQPRTGVGRWIKRAFLKGRYNWARQWFEQHPQTTALCWQGLTGARRAFMSGAQDAGAGRLFAELAPLPGYLTLDPKGVNAEGSVPRSPAFYDEIEPLPDLLGSIKTQFAARLSRRADVGQSSAMPKTGPFLFVPLQVPDDSQMLLFSGWVGSASGFVSALAEASRALPEGWHLRLKEHPSSRIPLTAEIDAAIADGARLVRDNTTDSFRQIEASAGVVTVNSSMGLQAMFWGKPVIVTGQAFFAIPGLATVADDAEALSNALSVPERLNFDAAFRDRFLTWLAARYYVARTETGFDRDAIARRLEGKI